MQLLTRAELQHIDEVYGTGPIDSWHVNNHGITNTTFELDPNFFLTVFNRRSAEELEAIAETANGLPEDVPIARPSFGKDGYTLLLEAGPALLTPRLFGKHYVGSTQTDKRPIPDQLHKSLARFFWDVQGGLSATPEELKQTLQRPSGASHTVVPEVLPEYIKPLTQYVPANYDPSSMPVYPDLVHDDMERQNILSTGPNITGLVDLDSLMHGDVLYEFGHFLFNVVFCDPAATIDTALIYCQELEHAGVIDPSDVPALYSSIYRFALYDVFEMQDIIDSRSTEREPSIDMKVVVAQYEKALDLARRFFACHYLIF